MEMNFWKQKEVFVGNDPLHKNISWFLHNYHSSIDSNISLRPIFQIFHNKLFHVLVTNFGRAFKAAGDEFLENKRGFCWEYAPSQKNSLIFYIAITFLEIQRYLWTLFFKNFPYLSS
jgi:hypothetical protein